MRHITIRAGDTMVIREAGDADAVKDALMDVLKFQVEGDARIFNQQNFFYEKGDEHRLFFTEAFAYPMFEDKDAARRLLGSMHNLCLALGYDMATLMRE